MLALLVLCIAALLADSESSKVLRFPEKLSTSNYVKLKPEFFEVNSAVSVCSWVKSSKSRKHSMTFWFSYAAPHQTNMLLIGDWELYLNGASIVSWKNVIMVKNLWYHYCLTWSLSTKVMDFYLNGVLVQSRSSGSTIAPGGIIVLGQDQDTYGGGFDVKQAFGGDMHLLNVFSRKLFPQEVAAMYSDGRCSRLPSTLMHDVVVSWEEFLGAQRYGAVQVVPTECGDRRNFLGKVTQLLVQELNTCNSE